MLSPWDLVIRKSDADLYNFTRMLTADTLTHDQYTELLATSTPDRIKEIPTRPSQQWTFAGDKEYYLLSFEGAARLKTPQSSYSYVVWKLPEWKVIAAHSFFVEGGTVNEAEYNGLLSGLQRCKELGLKDLTVWGDSRIVLQQMMGNIQCRAPNLQPLQLQGMELQKEFSSIRFAHFKREYNGAADWLASEALANLEGREIFLTLDHTKLQLLNETMRSMVTEVTVIPEGWIPGKHLQLGADTAKSVASMERAYTPTDDPWTLSDERMKRVAEAQDKEPLILQLKEYLRGNFSKLSAKDYKRCKKRADKFVLSEKDLLYYVTEKQVRKTEEPSLRFRLVAPRSMYQDILHAFHTEASGGHQGVQRTFQRIRRTFYWIGMFKDVEQYVRCCLDCNTGKGNPVNDGISMGNILPLRPGHVWAFDYVIPLPESFEGIVALLVYVDLFTGYCVIDAMRSTTALDVAKSFNKCIYQRFGACEILRHDRDPRFMSEVMTEFNKMLGQQQRANLAYRPQAGGQHENKVKIVTRAIKMYAEDERQRDWDEKGRCLMFCLNSAYDHTRHDTPFFLMHGWDPRNSIEAMLSVDQGEKRYSEAAEWRRAITRDYQYAREWALELQEKAKVARKDRHNDSIALRTRTDKIVAGSRVWVYVPHVKAGFAKKLAHLWHGPFRVVTVDRHVMCKLDVRGQARFHPTVHISRVKLCDPTFERPKEPLPADQDYDFDEALLPEDSFEPDNVGGEYEVEAILDHKCARTTAKGRYNTKFLIKWKGYEEPSWEKESNLQCGRLLYEYHQKMKQRNRSDVLVMSDEEIEATPTL